MKYSQWFGVFAALSLIVSGLLNWAWYPDLHKYFTGFSSENNMYGKPGKVFIFLAGVSIILFLVPRVWAKRFNIFLCALTLSYALKSFILFSTCYRATCPERQFGLWLMLTSAALMMLISLFPGTALKSNPSTE